MIDARIVLKYYSPLAPINIIYGDQRWRLQSIWNAYYWIMEFITLSFITLTDEFAKVPDCKLEFRETTSLAIYTHSEGEEWIICELHCQLNKHKTLIKNDCTEPYTWWIWNWVIPCKHLITHKSTEKIRLSIQTRHLFKWSLWGAF